LEKPLALKTVAVFARDQREIEAAARFLEWGAKVLGYGFSTSSGTVETVRCAMQAVRAADYVVAPVLGCDDQGWVQVLEGPPVVVDEAFFSAMKPGAVFFIGKASKSVRAAAGQVGVRLVEFREDDEFAILNSIPSAEGAVELAMKEAPITIHGSCSYVLGYGRTGTTLAGLLKDMGALVTVFARRRSQRARIRADGLQPQGFDELPGAIGAADLLFNTVPALVVGEQVLLHARRDLVIIDLASKPGGVDFGLAERLGIKAVLAPGLPGLVAPRTAGRIMAEVILSLICAEPSVTRDHR